MKVAEIKDIDSQSPLTEEEIRGIIYQLKKEINEGGCYPEGGRSFMEEYLRKVKLLNLYKEILRVMKEEK